MMKNMIAALICILLLAAMCSCGDEESSSAADTTTTAVTTAAPESVPEAVTTTTTTVTTTQTETSPTLTEATTESVTESITQTESSTTTTTSVTTTTTASKKPTQTTTTTVTTTTSSKKTEAPKPAFSEGTYKGSFGKYIDAMGADVRYDVTVKFENGSYDYTVEITLSGGMDHHAEEKYSGTYTVNGTSLTFTGQLKNGTVKKDGISLTGLLSSFASEDETLTVRK